MNAHLPLSRLEPGVDPTPAEQAHLDACAECRIEARLLASYFDAPPAPADVLPALETLRLTLSQSLAAGAWSADITPIEPDPDRYEVVGALGRGGMGEVVRVQDHHLGRAVAMKVGRQQTAGAQDRFRTEAQRGAQLQHPGVVPVHELGTLPDGRPYFTMKEVDGVTLTTAVGMLHATAEGGRWPDGANHTFTQLLEACRRVAETVAYAHSHGIVHRDLKPDNILLGAFGEVLVVDWGLAETTADATEGTAGTPAYLAPEQARGEAATTASDVYALGGILWMVAVGAPRFSGGSLEAVLQHRAAGDLVEWPPTFAGPVPGALQALVDEAMAADATARPGAAAFANALQAILEGAHKRGEAERMVHAAQDQKGQGKDLRAAARTASAQARRLLRALPVHAPATDKAEAWALEDRAASLEHEATQADLRYEQALVAALHVAPDLELAHEALALHHRRCHEDAVDRGAPSAADRHLYLLQQHDRGAHRLYLSGKAQIVVEPGATTGPVTWRRRTESERRLQIAEETPFTAPDTIEVASGRGELVYGPQSAAILPLELRRGARWSGSLPTPPPDLDTDTECWVPAGWCRVGGDPQAPASLDAQRVWLDGFVIQRVAVSLEDYLSFLNDLWSAGRQADALLHAPRERASEEGTAGALLLTETPTGLALRADAEGDAWDPAWPAWMIDWAGARAYAAWWAAQTGQPWRLPYEWEWEKAARGVDGRAFVWGDRGDETFAHVLGCQPGRPSPRPVGTHPTDESVYGVRDLAGNIAEWCLDPHEVGGPSTDADGRFVPPELQADDPRRLRTVKGGAWCLPLAEARAAFRDGRDAADRRWAIGFRLVRPL